MGGTPVESSAAGPPCWPATQSFTFYLFLCHVASGPKVVERVSLVYGHFGPEDCGLSFEEPVVRGYVCRCSCRVRIFCEGSGAETLVNYRRVVRGDRYHRDYIQYVCGMYAAL